MHPETTKTKPVYVQLRRNDVRPVHIFLCDFREILGGGGIMFFERVTTVDSLYDLTSLLGGEINKSIRLTIETKYVISEMYSKYRVSKARLSAFTLIYRRGKAQNYQIHNNNNNNHHKHQQHDSHVTSFDSIQPTSDHAWLNKLRKELYNVLLPRK
jgi:hypothetical protein